MPYEIEMSTSLTLHKKYDIKVMFSSLFVCLSVCLLGALRKNCRTDLHEIFREGWQWADEQKIKFWWRSGHRLDTGIASGFVTIGRYGKLYQPTAMDSLGDN